MRLLTAIFARDWRGAAKRHGLVAIALLLILAGTGYYLWARLAPGGFGALDESVLVEIPLEELPEDALYITEERRGYESGELTLVIPSLEVMAGIGATTTPEGLREMPGLYEFSELPETENGNVSVAGHRDIHDRVFYSLDQAAEGDFAYLLYRGGVYRYLFRDSKAVSPDAWDVIKPQGFRCLTLTTCDPIGTTINRLVARFEFVDQKALDREYQFAANRNDPNGR